MFQSWTMETRGFTSIEFGLVVGGVSAMLVSAGVLFGDELRCLYENMNLVADRTTDIHYEAE